jgi:hypothetical protein
MEGRTPAHALEAGGAHQTLDAFAADANAGLGEFGMNARRPVGPS